MSDIPTPLGFRRTFKIALEVGRLNIELARRGLSRADLEKDTGLSRDVLIKANTGQSISPATYRIVLAYLEKHPVLAAADALLGTPVVSSLANEKQPAPTSAKRSGRAA